MKSVRTGILAGFLLLSSFFIGTLLAKAQRGDFDLNDLYPLLSTLPILVVALALPDKKGACCRRVPVSVDSSDQN